MLIPHRVSFFFYEWGCSSDGRALALHARGTGIDTPHLHLFLFFYTVPIYLLYTIHIFTCLKRDSKNDNGRVRTYAPKGKLLSRQPP